VASAILMELNIRLTVLVVETARLERRGVNDIWRLLISLPAPYRLTLLLQSAIPLENCDLIARLPGYRCDLLVLAPILALNLDF
jgi:hypothetical protein